MPHPKSHTRSYNGNDTIMHLSLYFNDDNTPLLVAHHNMRHVATQPLFEYFTWFSIQIQNSNSILLLRDGTGICFSIPGPKGQGIGAAVVLADLNDNID